MEGDWDKDRDGDVWERTDAVAGPSSLPTGTPCPGPSTSKGPVPKISTGVSLNTHILETRRMGGSSEDEDDEDEEAGEGQRMLKSPRARGRDRPSDPKGERGRSSMGKLEFSEPDTVLGKGAQGRWRELRNLLSESTPSLLLSLIGLVFTGELLEHLARWRVFRRVDELFILVPMLGNLKGNLEMCLSARLGTSANIGELDDRVSRRALLSANLTLLGMQALLISSLAGLISFLLGLMTFHRVGNGQPGDPEDFDPGLAVGEQDWMEGYTVPGWKQLVMVLATGMASAGISGAVLGSFMESLILTSRWAGIDPDNITPPVAACLGDLLTLFIMALLGSLLVGIMDSPIPLIIVICLCAAAAWFTKRVMRNSWIRNVAKGGWLPLIGAMLISSGTGMVLDKGVGKYRGFALLAISMTGLTGSIGAIHANRLSTSLHTRLHPASGKPLSPTLTPFQSSITLYLLAFPCQGCFLAFVDKAGWVDFSLGWAGWASFALSASFSLASAHHMTLFFWSRDLDPDSYTLPVHSALVDFVGQLFLWLAYEFRAGQGWDVVAREVAASP